MSQATRVPLIAPGQLDSIENIYGAVTIDSQRLRNMAAQIVNGIPYSVTLSAAIKEGDLEVTSMHFATPPECPSGGLTPTERALYEATKGKYLEDFDELTAAQVRRVRVKEDFNRRV